MIEARFIKAYHYDFTDENTGKKVVGNTILCFVDDELVKVNINDDTYDAFCDSDIKFGDLVSLDIKVKGKYAKYVYIG